MQVFAVKKTFTVALSVFYAIFKVLRKDRYGKDHPQAATGRMDEQAGVYYPVPAQKQGAKVPAMRHRLVTA